MLDNVDHHLTERAKDEKVCYLYCTRAFTRKIRMKRGNKEEGEEREEEEEDGDEEEKKNGDEAGEGTGERRDGGEEENAARRITKI